MAGKGRAGQGWKRPRPSSAPEVSTEGFEPAKLDFSTLMMKGFFEMLESVKLDTEKTIFMVELLEAAMVGHAWLGDEYKKKRNELIKKSEGKAQKPEDIKAFRRDMCLWKVENIMAAVNDKTPTQEPGVL